MNTLGSKDYTLITEKEAKEIFELKNYINGFYGDQYLYLLFDGDVFFEGDLDIYKLCRERKEAYGIIVNGNITINGVLYQPDIDNGETLFVKGNLRAKSINKGGAEFYIKGNVTVEQTIYGYYNHGMLTVEGSTSATTILCDDHFFKFLGDVHGVLINKGTIEGAEEDYKTTEPLLSELKKANNQDTFDSDKINDYINAGKQIIQEKYIPKLKAEETKPMKGDFIKPKLISREEAQESFDLSQYDMDHYDFKKIIFFDGDTFVDGDLNQKWAQVTLSSLGKDTETADTLILINGNLSVNGSISISDYFPFLLILGNVTCDVLNSGDEFIYIQGDAAIKYAFTGIYNDGSIFVGGKTKVPFVLNSNHNSEILPVGATLINFFSDDNDFFEFDYTVKDFERVMVSEVLIDGEFDPFKFIELVKEGKSPLKKGAKPARLIFQEELDKMAESPENITELDLSDKKLKDFPLTLTKVKNLKKLILNDNPIGALPTEIANMESLEELHLRNCNLTTLPDSIALLPKLIFLDVSGNYGRTDQGEVRNFKFSSKLIGLRSLKVLHCNYNENLKELCQNFDQLVNLEELSLYQCSTSSPIDFPEVLTKIPNLKRLLIGSNSFRSIPESIVNLQNLEELNLDASLCYLDSFPDLSKMTNLKILHANGLISYTTRPSPKQEILKSFFRITSLEELYIDRHGERKESFIKKNQYEEIKNNLAHDLVRFNEFAEKLTIVPNKAWGDGRKGIVRENLKAEHLEGISNLENLKVLDLSFNGLDKLPEEIFELKKLQFLNLQYNKLSIYDRLNIAPKFSGCTIDFRNNSFEGEGNSEVVKYWKEMNTLIIEANELMGEKNHPEKLRKSLEQYDKVLEYFASGKVVDEYNLLYANYGKVWAYSYLNSFHKNTFTPETLRKSNLDAIEQGLKTLELIPNMIWHFTDLGKFHEEVTRITANSVAWQIYEIYDEPDQLQKAFKIITKATEYIENESHHFLYDTLVRILLKLQRPAEAYPVVHRILTSTPDFKDFQDFKNNSDYYKWVESLNVNHR